MINLNKLISILNQSKIKEDVPTLQKILPKFIDNIDKKNHFLNIRESWKH